MLLCCGVVAAGRGEMACPPLPASAGPSGGARLCGRRRLGMVGCGSHPAEGQERPGLQREARPQRPPLLQAGEETAESSPIGEPFISLFFTVINPSEHAASVAPGGEGRGEGEPRTRPGRKGGAPGFVAFRELCCHSNGAF